MKSPLSLIHRWFTSRGSKSKRSGESQALYSVTQHDTSHMVHLRLRNILDKSSIVQELSHDEFMAGWIAMASISPALNPDEAASEDGGWPLGWRPIAAEAFRRFESKELTKEELYPSPIKFGSCLDQEFKKL